MNNNPLKYGIPHDLTDAEALEPMENRSARRSAKNLAKQERDKRKGIMDALKGSVILKPLVKCWQSDTCTNRSTCEHGKPHAIAAHCIHASMCFDYRDGTKSGPTSADVWCEKV